MVEFHSKLIGILFACSVVAIPGTGAAQQVLANPTPDEVERIQQYVETLDAASGISDRDPLSVAVGMADLNGDGVGEALIYLEGSADCGAMGCGRHVVDVSGARNIALGSFIGQILVPLETTTNGWSDLSLDDIRIAHSDAGYVPAWRLTHQSLEAYIQDLLTRAGHYQGPIDGRIGDLTRAAISRFEAQAGLPMTGQMSRHLVAALESRAGDQPVIVGSAPIPSSAQVAGPWGDPAPDDAPDRNQIDATCSIGAGDPSLSRGTPADGNLGGGADEGTILGYSDGPDRAYIGDTPGIVGHMTGAGDDYLVIDAPGGTTGMDAGSGADTVVLCVLRDTQSLVMLGLSDLDADRMILAQHVFTRPPPSGAMLMIGGFSAVEDRLIIDVPDGVEVTFDEIFIRVGTVAIMVIRDQLQSESQPATPITLHMADGRVLTPPERFWSNPAFAGLGAMPDPNLPERTAPGSGTGAHAGRLDGSPFEGVLPFHDCDALTNGSDVIRPAMVTRTASGATGVLLDDGGNLVIVDGSDGTGRILSGLGDDLIHLLNAPAETDITAGGGADVVVVCSAGLQNRQITVVMGDGGAGTDIDADTLILRADSLIDAPSGHARAIRVFGFAPSNDRLIVELPPGADVSILSSSHTNLVLDIGRARITLHSSELLTASAFDLSSVIIQPVGTLDMASETASAAPRAGTGSATGGGSCGFAGLANYAPSAIVPNWGADYHYLTHESDRVRVPRLGRPIAMHGGRGNDHFAFEALDDDLRLDAGTGADRIDLCSMSGLTTHLDVGIDRDVDTVVIHRALFEGIPEGMTRTVFINGLEPSQDRVVVDAPPEFADWQGASRGQIAIFGPLRVYLLGAHIASALYPLDSVEIAAPESVP